MKPMDHQEPDRTNEPDSAFLLRPKIEEAEKDAMTSEDRLEQPKEIQEATEEKTYETRNGGEIKGERATKSATKTVSTGTQATPQIKDETIMAIENILADNLSDVFVQMTPEQQQEFQKKGEEAAEKIKNLIETAKATTKKVLKIIRDWLKRIPGVNHFFLEQEAKIKTDKILDLVQEKKRDKLHLD